LTDPFLFGATLGEVGLPPSLSDDPGGFDDITFYQLTGLRPAAFIGNITDEPGAYLLPFPEIYPTTGGGRECYYRNIEASGNWHSQFLFYWILLERGLADAMREANDLAWDSGAFPPPPSQNYLVVGTDYLGNSIYYDPAQCLKIAGYRNLRFNQFNHDYDAW
jgi:hypothetical protein